MKKLVGTILLAAAIGGGAYAYLTFANGDALTAASKADSVPTFQVKEGPFQVSLTTVGELRAAKSAVLGAPFGGKITKLVPEGTRVEPGDPVIWFETEEVEQELQEEEAQLALDEQDLQAAKEAYELEKVRNEYTLQSEKTRVEIARQNYEDRKQKYEAEKRLFDRNISPQTKLDEARLAMLQAELELRNAQINLSKVEENLAGNLRVKERDIEKARLQVERMSQEVDEERRQLESAIVRANSRGDISYLKIWKSGDVAKVAEGDQVWRRSNLIEIPDTSEMNAIVPVNEIDISRVQEGQRAEVELKALPGRIFSGEVVGKSIVPITDPTKRSWDSGNGDRQGPREFEVRIRLTEHDDIYRQGMTASARIILQELDSALQVPLEALHEQEGEKGVWVEENGEPAWKPLQVQMTNDNFAAFTGPIAPGDEVYLADPRTPGAALLGLDALASTAEEEEETTAADGEEELSVPGDPS